MAKIVSNHMVQHLWANQSQEEARSANGNHSFSGTVLYSYSTPIANLVTGNAGQRVALVTSKTYSVTTSCKHMPGRALGYRYHSVPFIGMPGGQNRIDSWDMGEVHGANLEYLTKAYEATREHLKRARSIWGGPREQLARPFDALKAYAMDFGLPYPAFDLEADAKAIEAHRAARNTPEAIAKRAKEAAKRRAIKAARDAEAARLAGLAWIEGGARRPYGGPVLLRVATSGRTGAKVVETSLGAIVPLEDAIKVFRVVMSCRVAKRTWKRNGEHLPVGQFQVDMIGPDGDFVAGCHSIKWPEVERLAGTLGLL